VVICVIKKGFFNNLRINREYIFYYAKTMLKQRVANSYLGVMWLFLDPLFFMMIYTFLVVILFNNASSNFHIQVFIGITTWKFISTSISNATTSISKNKAVFEQVYFHKFVYPTSFLLVNLYNFLITNTLIIALMLISNVSLSLHMLEFIPITFVISLFIYGIALIVSHIGIYFNDIKNILDIILRFIFYLTPVIWNYETINSNISFVSILKWNPASIIIESYRDVLFRNTYADYLGLFFILIFSLILIFIGYRLISKYESDYGKVS
jgi:ABC-type polysaccharide/polyol phosphate export permease